MPKKLDEIVHSSYAGYIDSHGEIAQIIKRIVNLPLPTLLDAADTATVNTLKDFLSDSMEEEYKLEIDEREGLKEELIGTLNYTDLLCFADHTLLDFYDNPEAAGVEEGDDHYHLYIRFSAEQPYRYLELSYILQLLLNAEKANLLVRMFLSIHIKAFFEYLESISRGRAAVIRKMQQQLKEKAAALDIATESGTIESVLTEARRIIWKEWYPWQPLGKHVHNTLSAYDIYSILLIGCFKCVYPKRFHMENIITKLKSHINMAGRE